MSAQSELRRLSDKFDALRNSVATKRGSLQEAVEALKESHGVSTADEARKVIKELQEKVADWEKERDKLLLKIERSLDGIDDPDDVEEEEDDFDDFE